jgi:hypothetical protein
MIPIRRKQDVNLLTWTQGFNLNLLRPFVPLNIENPNGRKFPQELRGFVNPAEVHLIGKDTFFAAPGEAPRYDWPNPTRSRSRLAAMTSQPQCNLLETTLASAATNRRRRIICGAN